MAPAHSKERVKESVQSNVVIKGIKLPEMDKVLGLVAVKNFPEAEFFNLNHPSASIVLGSIIHNCESVAICSFFLFKTTLVPSIVASLFNPRTFDDF